MSLRFKKLQVAAMVLSIGLAACSDTSGPGTGEFDAPGTTAELNAVDATFETPAYQSLAALGQYFENGPVAQVSATAAMIEATHRNASGSMSDMALRNAPRVSAQLSASAPIPGLQEYYGTQFVYSEAEGKYVPAEQGEAPENGIRVIIYAINPITDEIASPLAPIGHVDIIDVNPASSAQIAVQVIVVSGEVTYTDYTVTTTLGAEVGIGASVNATGYLTDGTTRANFDLTHTASFDFEGAQVTIDYHIDIEDRDFAIDVLMTVEGTEGSNTTTLEVQITHNGNWVKIVGGGTNGSVVLEVRRGAGDGEGELFATITATDTGLEVLGADGEPLNEEEAQALRKIWSVIEDAFSTFDELFKPVQWLFED